MEKYLKELFKYFDIIRSNYSSTVSLDYFEYSPDKTHSFQVKIFKQKDYDYFNDFYIDIIHALNNYFIDGLTIRYRRDSEKFHNYYRYNIYNSVKKDPHFFYLDSEKMDWNEIIKNIKLLTIQYI